MAAFESEKAQFDRDGFVIVRNLLSSEETELLAKISRADVNLAETAYGREDGKGAVVTLAVRNELQQDYYSSIVKSQRIVKRMSALLGDEVYHYHHKLILKEPRVGGAWEWHQDYGYWYNNGCLTPDMGSCLIAIDRATEENGCLQVLRGSHQIGRINHGPIGDQTGADLERVAVAVERYETVHVELEPGSAVFFHSNLLHRSDQNTSENPRWALICCYNTKKNDPYKESRHPGYSPLDTLPDDQLLNAGHHHLEQLTQQSSG
ncbi:phytanoyl-CoA dioxygenase family protein [Thalassoglobus polymorphus]|uniref:1-deoxypentalenic acid 11-beta-hydroxylase n=1 Tax=Thalassoglobus polymorphus TaxID=2527994 RepID=A0A517QMT2_9PLAN|nr:phytanoyl-CoA dioxygenase family protein [Thalassoglobus polymorphus]QDT32867.1 1-deoxypentalenic acid 11-beta-hydroxylase [Thalassoglobus polymorphus]